MFITILATLAGCGAAPDPSSSPEGRLCGRAYGSTIDSLDELYTKAGKDMPTPIAKDKYVEMCVGMGFTEDQLKCMDPKIASVDETCPETLKAVEDKKKKLAQSLLPKADKGGDDKKEGGE